MMNNNPQMPDYTSMAQNLMGRTPEPKSTMPSVSSMGMRPDLMSMQGLSKFARTPAGKTAIQGAVDAIIAQRQGGANPVNPYEYIVSVLRNQMQQSPPTA